MPTNDDGIFCLLLVPPTRACDFSVLEAAANNGEEGIYPVFVSVSSNFSLPTKAFLDGSDCLKMEYRGQFPKLCGVKSSMVLTTAQSRADSLLGVYNFPFNNNRTIRLNKFKSCTTDQATKESIRRSMLFNLDDKYSFTQPKLTAIEAHQVGYVAITRPERESKGLVFVETVPGSADKEDFISFSGFVFFESGERKVHFPIGIKFDNEDEQKEFFVVKIINGNHTVISRGKRSPGKNSDEVGGVTQTRLSIIGEESDNYILTFDPEVFRTKIKEEWIKRGKIDEKMFLKGYKGLHEAVLEQKLLPGMSIWKASPLPFRLPNFFLRLTFQYREFAFFHVAVYVGSDQQKEVHFVMENGGKDNGPWKKGGTIGLRTFEEAFHDGDIKHKYFLVSPPPPEGTQR